MDSVGRNGHYFVTRITTGPQDLLLLLDLADERIADPFVSAIEVCPVYGRPTDEAMRAAVLAGTDRANGECGTSLHPLEVRFSYSGYDRERCSLAGAAAYNIVRAIAAGKVAAE
ncbi:hypothetical protein [Limnoglobus roseus]|uniref:Uncharacterized protein n=1 Tax=Limnoglobus roseus TaxID=2598579 RepID=A0A5C1AC86_9BACT|nr:hypothetical protein [Limnoglobus roseus]QEL14638.1 hypothetical protein PX52LOC_01530 [Limnoglobus roseus]